MPNLLYFCGTEWFLRYVPVYVLVIVRTPTFLNVMYQQNDIAILRFIRPSYIIPTPNQPAQFMPGARHVAATQSSTKTFADP